MHSAIAYINGLVQDCSISIANALRILQSCTKPSIYGDPVYTWYNRWTTNGEHVHSCIYVFPVRPDISSKFAYFIINWYLSPILHKKSPYCLTLCHAYTDCVQLTEKIDSGQMELLKPSAGFYGAIGQHLFHPCNSKFMLRTTEMINAMIWSCMGKNK